MKGLTGLAISCKMQLVKSKIANHQPKEVHTKILIAALKWLDTKFEQLGMKLANFYLKNFCHYK